MSYCIYKVNTTGELLYDVDAKFPNGLRAGYTVLECGLGSKDEAEERLKEINEETAGQES